jgi:hypothetical protein
MVTDHRALPDRVLNLYLYPIGAWAIGFGGLYFAGYGAFAIPLCYPLALWQGVLSGVWGRRLLRRVEADELTLAEAHAGVRSVGQILSWSAMSPAVVFLTQDPLAPEAWSTTVGAVIVSLLVYLAINGLTRIQSRWTDGVAIAIGCLALPLNATGAVTAATMVGWFDAVLEASPVR